jgi:hypothetical protein
VSISIGSDIPVAMRPKSVSHPRYPRIMSKWQVELTGHQFDLEDLPRWFTAPELRVVEQDGRFLLEAERFDDLHESAAVHAAAYELLPRIIGVAKLKNGSFRDVAVGSAIRELDEEGRERSHLVLLAGTAELRAKASGVLVKVGEDELSAPAPGSLDTDQWLRAAKADPEAQEVLDILGGRPHDWVNLYKVYEIVRSRADVKSSGWASDNELTRFTRTANHPDAAGQGARHGRMSAYPPPKPMSLSEADALVGRIVIAWLGSLP